MQFMLEMQAKHEAAMQKHDEQIARNSEQIAVLEKSVATVTDLVGRVAKADLRLVERIQETTAQIGELREIQARADYKLNALIDTVDKLARHNGGTPKP